MDTVNSVYSYVEHTVSMYYCVHVENNRKSYFVVGAHKDFAFFLQFWKSQDSLGFQGNVKGQLTFSLSCPYVPGIKLDNTPKH